MTEGEAELIYAAEDLMTRTNQYLEAGKVLRNCPENAPQSGKAALARWLALALESLERSRDRLIGLRREQDSG